MVKHFDHPANCDCPYCLATKKLVAKIEAEDDQRELDEYSEVEQDEG